MVKSRRIRSRLNTNASNTSTKVESIKEVLTSNGIGHCEDQDHGSVASYNSETGDIECHPGSTEQLVYPQLIRQLIIGRLLLFAIQCIAGVFPDAPTDAFKGVEAEDFAKSRVLRPLLGGLTRWDARHFLHIAEHGYTWESTLAFFPLFPMCLRVIGGVLKVLLPSFSLYSCMIIGGVLVNNAIFIINGLLLYSLCLKLTKSEKESILAIFVYSVNPASIFFSAVYTETLYMMFTLLGLTCIYDEKKSPDGFLFKFLASSCCFSLAFFTRSNGWLNFGYIGYAAMIDVLTHNGSRWERKSNILVKAMKYGPLLLICLLLIVLPLRSFSTTQEERYCRSTTIFSFDQSDPPFHDEYTNRILPGDVPNLKWCTKRSEFSLLPVYYPSIQKHYWDVGLFQYWQLKKIPLFILAAPTLIVLLYGVMDIVLDITLDSRSGAVIISETTYLIPFAIHSTLLGIGALFFYNVEVVTRILFSSSPFMYITIARIMSEHCPRIKCPEDLLEPPVLPFFANYFFVRTASKLLTIYLLGYCFIGTIAFVKWLPFV
ncbi:unnamed protein product [Bursaphelenchus xylophilus]|uniref:GPI mannosyltransferase 2 n=1 Tax=Bursaphelenchus xylophilus TaxID=6326 RepID=A0A1I7S7S6_BURXY|nr:unnamed protein product [Bursaphelenchus xylophilus]CAG9086933.1 unnamed protein product [Bursaphelenchus xylophilus]